MLKLANWMKVIALSIALLGGAAAANAEPYPAPIQSLQAQGIEIVESFQSPSGLRGYIGRYQGRALEIYLASDDYAVVGTMINGEGESVAAPQLRAAAASSIDWSSLADTHWIAEGDPKGERIVYAFMDPNCPYCGQFWQASRDYINTPGVQLRFIMVGMLRPSSEALAAGILGASDPVAALTHYESNREPGKEPKPGKVANSSMKQVRDNTNYMRSQDIYATPTVVYQDRDGRVQLLQGLPSDQMMKEEIFRR